MENVYPGEDKTGWRKRVIALRILKGSHVKKGLYVFSMAPKENSDMRRSRMDKMRENFLFLNCN